VCVPRYPDRPARGQHQEKGLARIMHEPPAATADMAVLPGVLGSRTLRRTEQVRLRSESRGAGWLPGGTIISTISQRRLAHNAGWVKRGSRQSPTPMVPRSFEGDMLRSAVERKEYTCGRLMVSYSRPWQRSPRVTHSSGSTHSEYSSGTPKTAGRARILEPW